MSDAVTIEIIRATAAIVPTAGAIYAAMMSRKSAKASKKASEESKGASIKLDGILKDRVQAATDIGHAEGKAAGIKEERKVKEKRKQT